VVQPGENEGVGTAARMLMGLRRIEAASLKWDDGREGEMGPVIEIRATKGAEQRDPLPLSPLAGLRVAV
jgi:hypothetical protein